MLALAWAIVVPPFQAPDENSHFGYVQNLAERGKLPGDKRRPVFSTEQTRLSRLANSDQTAANRGNRPTWSEAVWRTAQADRSLSRTDGGGLNPARTNPPLYYALAVAPYRAVHGSSMWSRLFAGRLVSVLLLLVTVAATWALIGEVVVRRPVLQLVGAGVVALQPMEMFISASLTPDSLLFATWALAFWLAARILRRGLSARDAIALGLATAAGILTKSTTYALVPGVLLAALLAARRMRGSASRREILRPLAAGAAALAAPVLGWLAYAHFAGRAAINQVGATDAHAHVSLRYFGNYLWNFYLPRPGFIRPFSFDSAYPAYQDWIKEAFAQFGWLETTMPGWVYAAITVALAVAFLGAVGVLVRRRRTGARDGAFLAFAATVVLALLAGLHWTDFRTHVELGQNFIQGRYLLPLLPFLGLAAAGAATAVRPERRSLVAGVTLGLAAVLQLGCLAVVVTRFYA